LAGKGFIALLPKNNGGRFTLEAQSREAKRGKEVNVRKQLQRILLRFSVQSIGSVCVERQSTNFPFCTFPSPQFCIELSDHEQLYKACFFCDEARLVSPFYDSARRKWHDIGCDLCTQTCNDRNCEACICCGSGDEAQAYGVHQRHLSGQAAQCRFRHIRKG
jgi:hypothetical protein